VQQSGPQRKNNIYLDHNATTPIHLDLYREIPEWLEAWGNPSSIHWASRQPKVFLRESRMAVAKMIGAQPLEIIFTSGGTESNNTVLKSTLNLLKDRPHVMCSSVEHSSVFKTFRYLESQGAQWDIIPVDRYGRIDLDFYKTHLSDRTALVSVMLANNETGNIFPIGKMAKWAHGVGALFHTDAVQGLGKLPIDVVRMGVDYASFSGHKFYSLKGTGFIYCKKGSPLTPLLHGGGQERHRRGGTENTLGIEALGFMARQFSSQVEVHGQRLQVLRDLFETKIKSELEGVRITGADSERLANTSSLILEGVDGETLLMSLDIKGFAVSTGAACSSGNPEPSPVLLAMGLTRAEAQNSLRVSLGWSTTEAEILYFIETLKSTVKHLRSVQAEIAGGHDE